MRTNIGVMKEIQMTVGAYLRGALCAAALAALPSVGSAHHSFAMFDLKKGETVNGTVKGYLYANPHSTLVLTGVDASGKTVDYLIQLVDVRAMIRLGLRADTFKVGDKVAVELNPLRDGSPGGAAMSITDAKGVNHEIGRPDGGSR